MRVGLLPSSSKVGCVHAARPRGRMQYNPFVASENMVRFARRAIGSILKVYRPFSRVANSFQNNDFADMTDQPEQDHWDLLASELGTPPPPPKKTPQERSDQIDSSRDNSAEDEGASAPAKAVSPPRRRSPSPRAAKPRRTANGWSELAAELGVEVPQQPAEAATVSPPPEPAAPPEEPMAEAVTQEPSDEAIVVELPDGAAEHVELVEPGAEPIEAEPEEREAQATEQDNESSRQKSGRRRRRRRRPARSRDQTETADDEMEVAGDDETEAAAERAVETSGASTGDGEPSRSKRRRRRRPGRKRGAEAESNPDRPENETAAPGDTSPTQSMATAEAGLSDAGAESSAPQDQRNRDLGRTKPSHRGVPTWRDSVEILISANMEARAKKPDRGSSSRGRGGRSRGGRDRKRKE